jgi:hypothetical protein
MTILPGGRNDDHDPTPEERLLARSRLPCCAG